MIDNCIIILIKAIPRARALYRMFLSMEGDEQIGGVCGYMGLFREPVLDDKGKPMKYSQFDKLS